MDIGNPNFIFTNEGDEKEKKVRTIRPPDITALHINSLDRYTDLPGGNFVTQAYAQMANNILGNARPANNFEIQLPRALLNGYFTRVALDRIQLQIKLPTVITGYNDSFLLAKNDPAAGGVISVITIPQGFYTPTTMAATLQTLIRAAPAGTAGYTVAYTGVNGGFTFATNTADTTYFWVPNFPPNVTPEAQATVYFRTTGRLLGGGRTSYAVPETGGNVIAPATSFTTTGPNFNPTDYIDVCSYALTQFEEAKPTNSSASPPSNLLARVNLGVQGVQTTTAGNTGGAQPFTAAVQWPQPIWFRWSKESAVNNIDFRLLDMFGDPIFWNTTFNTEFQLSLMFSES
jgi:hypothetical protein